MKRWITPLVFGLLLVGCLIGVVGGGTESQTGSTVDIAAASSLSDVLEHLAPRCRNLETVGEVSIATAGSQTIARQIARGQPADLVLLANERWMQYLEDRNRLRPESLRQLLTNRLVLIGPTRGPPPLHSWQELREYRGTLALGNPRAVPAGIYARRALEAMGTWARLKPTVVSFPHVRAVVSAVQSGNLRLGVVYRSDARPFPDSVEVIDTIPQRFTPPIRYPIALTRDPDTGAGACYRVLISESAREVYRRYGFSIPTS